MRRDHRFRSEDAASLPHPKRRCGAKAATASEDALRRARRAPCWSPPDSQRRRYSGRQGHPTTPPTRGRNEPSTRPSEGAAGPGVGGQWGRSREQRATGGPGGCPPGKIPRAIAKRTESPGAKRRRVATGANHPASHSSAFRRGPGTPAGAPTGDQSTAMHVTPKPPLARQDLDYRLSRSALFS
jgi:hypothetical protein